MNNEDKKIKSKTKNRAYSTMIFGFFLCFFMVGVYIVANNISKSYAMPIEIDAENISSIESNTQSRVEKKDTGEITYIDATEVFDANTYRYAPYNPYPNNSQEEKYYDMVDKFKGNVTLDQQTYSFDMFCLEATKAIPNTTVTYERSIESDSLIDEGINYIINKAYEDATFENNALELEMPDYYNAQIAIWIYQELTKENPFELEICSLPSTPEQIACSERNGTIRSLSTTWSSVSNNHASGAAEKIYNYVTEAQNIRNNGSSENAIKVIAGDIELNLTDDKNYYETGLIEVSVTTEVNTEFKGFNFVLNNNDIDAIVVDEDGTEITDYASLQNKKFKIRIPASSVSEGTTTKITGDFSGKFVKSSYLAYKVANNNDYQIALLAASTTVEKTVPLKLEITVPDTGVDYSQYIYIIGAMVLVIGLTVIYVNTKAKEI